MKRLLTVLTFIILVGALTVESRAQVSKFITDWNVQITVSPTSIKLFGQTPSTAKFTISYGMVELVYFQTYSPFIDEYGLSHNTLIKVENRQLKNIVINGYSASDFIINGASFGIFINPIQFNKWNFSITGGIGWMFRKYPDVRGRHLQFQLQFAYMMNDWLGVSWSHISSGFNLFDQCNLGVDNFSLIINI